jgi:cyclic-di-GMP phosphodiesterase TipF (flagellum assembly factor)
VTRASISRSSSVGRLILALPQRSWRTLDAEQAGALAALRERIGLALEAKAATRSSAPRPASRSSSSTPTFAWPTPRAASAAGFARSGVRLVAEGVEREADVPDLIDLDLPLAQGTVFSPPRIVRPVEERPVGRAA